MRALNSEISAFVACGPINADGIEATFRVGQGVLTVDPGVIYVGAGRVTGRGELRYGEGGELEVELSGQGVPLARMVAWGGVHAPLAGRVTFNGKVGGSLDAPSAEAELRLVGVAVAGVPFGDGTGHVRLVALGVRPGCNLSAACPNGRRLPRLYAPWRLPLR